MNITHPVALATVVVLALTTAFAAPAAAQEPRAADVPLTVFHEAPAVVQAGESAHLLARVTGDWKADAITVHFRPVGSEAAFTAVPFQRASDGDFEAVINARDLQPPGIEYYIASTDRDGHDRLHFGSPTAPHPVVAIGETDELVEAERLARHHGHRSSFELRGQYTLYGRRLAAPYDSYDDTTTNPNSDRYWVGEAEYTYRRLGALYDLFFGIGVMRGDFATVDVNGQSVPASVAPGTDAPGLNYGYGGVTLELLRNLSVAGRLTLGASARGFAAGVGGLVRIGRIAGTRFEIGGELLQDAGNKGFLRFAWDTVPRVPMALTMEVDGWPDADANPTGTRLFYQAGVELPAGVTLIGQVGRVTRNDAVDSGWLGGLVTRYEF